MREHAVLGFLFVDDHACSVYVTTLHDSWGKLQKATDGGLRKFPNLEVHPSHVRRAEIP